MNNDLVQIIREKTDIVDIIGERIPLEKRGKNFFGVCPFHDDTSPSLCVSREKQIYTCFSCHATGNVFTFLMNYDKMTFPNTLAYLGDKVGVDTKGLKVKKTNTKYDKYYDIYDLSKKYFQNNLSSEAGNNARNYLKSRGINDEIIKKFEIGLSLNSKDDLTKLLTLKKYELVDLNKIGLSSDSHDIYIDRIMFPLYDLNGRVVAFSGRRYDNIKENKYVNTKETPIFKKGELLYHYHIAREESRIKKCVIIMEGFMDVIRASSIGINNTIALMGTALTKEHINLIKKLSNNIILCLDGDAPGRKAAYNIGDMFLKENIEVKVVTLPNDDDPDSFILNNGEDSFKSYIENAVNYNDYKINSMKENVNFNSIEETSNYINKVLEELVNVTDSIRIEIILKKLAKDYNIGYNTLEKKFSDLKEKNIKPEKISEVKKASTSHKNKYRKAIEQVIYFMLTNEWTISEVSREKILITDEDLRILVNEIIYYYEKRGTINIADFITYLSDKEKLLDSFNDIINSDYTEQVDKKTLYLYFKVIRDDAIKKQIKVLNNRMKDELDPVKQATLANEIAKLRKEEEKNG